jgi:hypothetical protein
MDGMLVGRGLLMAPCKLAASLDEAFDHSCEFPDGPAAPRSPPDLQFQLVAFAVGLCLVRLRTLRHLFGSDILDCH